MSLIWKESDTGKSHSNVTGNDRNAYAQASSEIKAAMLAGRQIDENGLRILQTAKNLGVYRD